MTPDKTTRPLATSPDKPTLQNRSRLVQFVLICALLLALIGNGAVGTVNAQDDQAAQPDTTEESVVMDEEPTEAAPVPGALQLTLSGSDGAALAGSFAVVDAAGTYFEVQVDGGSGWAEPLSAGPASVSQIFSMTDYQAAPSTVVTIPEGDVAFLQIVNIFMDADGDTVGDSVDVCALGNDFVDTDADTIPDACDPTPEGEPTLRPEPDASSEPEAPTVTPTADLSTPILGEPPLSATAEPLTPIPTDASPVVEEGESAVSVEIGDQEIVIENSRTSCARSADATPRVTSDLADYAPGSLVTLTGDGWVPGQVVEIVVDDDGVADAEQGPWELHGSATADAQGHLFYQFDIAPWYVAQYTVVVTGECSEARTDFTDSVSAGASFQMSCTPSSTTVAVPATLAVSCTLSATSLASGTTANVTIPSLAAPTGWTATAPSPSSGTVTASTPFSFSVTFTSSCSASTTAQSVTVSSSVTLSGETTPGPVSLVALARGSGTTASVGITSSSLSWTRPYSMAGYATNSGSISYSLQATGCNGWNVTISSTNFIYSGPNSGAPISAANLTLTGSTLPSGTGISAPVTSGALSSALRVLSASPSNGIGTYVQTLDLNLNVPPGAISGQYQASVTIAVTSGP